jgi:hypothetical protein
MNLRLLLDESDAAEEPKLISCKQKKNDAGDGVDHVVTIEYKGKKYTTTIFRDSQSQFRGWHVNLPGPTKYQDWDGTLPGSTKNDAINALKGHLKAGSWDGKKI